MLLIAIFYTLTLCHAIMAYEFNDRSPDLYEAEYSQEPGSEAAFREIPELSVTSSEVPVAGIGLSEPPQLESAQEPANETCGVPPPFCFKSRYRSMDGSCNNLRRPSWGMAETPYGRLLPFNYADGIGAMPVSSSGRPLPNPRALSLELFPDIQLLDPKWTLAAQQWGQVITHDMSMTANVMYSHKNALDNCDENGHSFAAEHWFNDAPILIPRNDPVYAPQTPLCISFRRTGTTKDRGCTPAHVPAEPLSGVTAYMDLSLVYGSNASQANTLRAGRGGRLLTAMMQGRIWPPLQANTTEACYGALSPDEPCFLAGDERANQNPQLTVLQVILLREHNRIADILAQYNPHWNDETIYQEARRIHIAQMQHITYHEYLPILLGYENMVSKRLIYPEAQGYVNDYDSEVDPSVLSEHASAAFRHFHTLIRGYLELMTESRTAVNAIRLSDWFSRPLVVTVDNVFDELLRGLTVQRPSASDQYIDSEVTQCLFRQGHTLGGDLRATDIQRGRDHGLGSYIDMREACGLPVPNNFEDMMDFISPENVRILQVMYESPEDVELVVAGALERLVEGTLAGPTYLCILTEQFYRTRVGDRYFYENGTDPDIAFTPSQLQAIRKGASLARLICDNGDEIERMQPKAFEQLSELNKLVPCDQLPSVDLTLWRDVRDITQNGATESQR